MDKSLNEFKEWFAIHYPESKDYLEITFFDYGKKLFVAKDTWNPDSVIAAKVLRMTFKAWQHQQAKVEELESKLKQAYEDVDTFATAHERECGFKVQFAKEKAELQKKLDAFERMFEIEWTDLLPSDKECSYDHVYGTCVLGRFSIEWKSWKIRDNRTIYLNNDYVDEACDLDSAKQLAQKHLEQALKGEADE